MVTIQWRFLKNLNILTWYFGSQSALANKHLRTFATSQQMPATHSRTLSLRSKWLHQWINIFRRLWVRRFPLSSSPSFVSWSTVSISLFLPLGFLNSQLSKLLTWMPSYAGFILYCYSGCSQRTYSLWETLEILHSLAFFNMIHALN